MLSSFESHSYENNTTLENRLLNLFIIEHHIIANFKFIEFENDGWFGAQLSRSDSWSNKHTNSKGYHYKYRFVLLGYVHSIKLYLNILLCFSENFRFWTKRGCTKHSTRYKSDREGWRIRLQWFNMWIEEKPIHLLVNILKYIHSGDFCI